VTTAPKTLLSSAQELFPKLLGLRELHRTPVVLIDGRAGSGKSTLSGMLKDLVFQVDHQSPRVIHMDDLYPGWEGLSAGSLYLAEQILRPLAQAGKAQWQRWDWEREIRGGKDEGNGWRSFEGDNLLIVEGCGSLTQASKVLSHFSIWVESEKEQRKERFLARDNDKCADRWSAWSAQEDEFYQEAKSTSLADVIIQN
jgi:uridine kinase